MPLSPAKLTAARERAKLDTRKLARHAHTTEAHVRQLEDGRGLASVSLNLVERLAKALGVTVNDLLED